MGTLPSAEATGPIPCLRVWETPASPQSKVRLVAAADVVKPPGPVVPEPVAISPKGVETAELGTIANTPFEKSKEAIAMLSDLLQEAPDKDLTDEQNSMLACEARRCDPKTKIN
jgi:hypothetical protein